MVERLLLGGDCRVRQKLVRELEALERGDGEAFDAGFEGWCGVTW